MIAQEINRTVGISLDFSDGHITCKKTEQNQMAEIRTPLENMPSKTSLADGTEWSNHLWEIARNLFKAALQILKTWQTARTHKCGVLHQLRF